MPQRIVQVDAFTDKAFSGNPAAVCILDHDRPDAWLQAVALEMNLSETAFLRPATGGYSLRWFTPVVEVDLCGHATLASAHVLFSEGRIHPTDTARFLTRSGELTATREANGRIILDFPALPAEDTEAPAGLISALGVQPVNVARSRFDYVVEVESPEAVTNAKPDFGAIARVQARGIILTARADTPANEPASGSVSHDFVSRFFAPAAGVDEDPVTGSAHCCLAHYWAKRLGRVELLGWQASKRGGSVHVRLAGDRVFLAGHAITVLDGNLLVDRAAR